MADLSMLSKAETERIWLPFTIWLTAAPALLPPCFAPTLAMVGAPTAEQHHLHQLVNRAGAAQESSRAGSLCANRLSSAATEARIEKRTKTAVLVVTVGGDQQHHLPN